MKRKLITSIMFIAIISLVGCAVYGEFKDAELDVPTIVVESDSIKDGNLITAISASKAPNNPIGENQSPQLSWESVSGANYYAICMFDETANWLHFFVTDIKETSIRQGQFTAEDTYIGPYPPKSDSAHKYRIEVFAIKEMPKSFIGNFDGKNSYEEIINHLNQVGGNSDNILARGYISGTYKHGTENK